MAYMQNAGLIAGLDVSATPIDLNYFSNNTAGYDPFETGNISPALALVGGRLDIGFYTEWGAQYLAEQSSNSLEIMLQNADAGGGLQWHYADTATGEIVIAPDDIDGIQSYRNNLKGGGTFNEEPDSSHKPQLAYLPYLVTGDRYYFEELTAATSHHFATMGTLGDEMFFYPNLQTRSQAWMLRDLHLNTLIAPDGSATKVHFENYLDHFLQEYIDFFINNIPFNGGLSDPYHGTEFEGVLSGYIYRGGLFRPWMQDHFGIVLGEISRTGNEKAKVLADWMANYTAGRFLQDDFDPISGAGYQIGDAVTYLIDPAIDTWAELDAYNKSVNNISGSYVNINYPNSPEYPTLAWASLGSLFSGTKDARYAEAYLTVADFARDRIVNFTGENAPGQIGPSGGMRTSFAPRFEDGTIATFDNHIYGQIGGDTINGTAANEVIITHGDNYTTNPNTDTTDAGNDVVNTGAGNHLVDTGDGDDIINAGNGEDWLFGGSGSDILRGGGGVNYLQGDRHDADFGRFQDTFEFTGILGQTTIGDFTVGQDKLKLTNIQGLSTAQQVINAFTNVDGGTKLSVGNDFIFLKGVSKAQLNTSDFTVTGDTPPPPPAGDSVQDIIDATGPAQYSNVGTDGIAPDLQGGAGNDHLIAMGERPGYPGYGSLARGGDGNDYLVSTIWGSGLFGDAGNDVVNLRNL